MNSTMARLSWQQLGEAHDALNEERRSDDLLPCATWRRPPDGDRVNRCGHQRHCVDGVLAQHRQCYGATLSQFDRVALLS